MEAQAVKWASEKAGFMDAIQTLSHSKTSLESENAAMEVKLKDLSTRLHRLEKEVHS
jgi:prefoldin subunit 5